jgi:hypothetical protein
MRAGKQDDEDRQAEAAEKGGLHDLTGISSGFS